VPLKEIHASVYATLDFAHMNPETMSRENFSLLAEMVTGQRFESSD